METTGEGENWWEVIQIFHLFNPFLMHFPVIKLFPEWINFPIWQAVDLQKLILAHNDIAVLREDLKNLACLVVLNVSHNNLSQLPAAIGE